MKKWIALLLIAVMLTSFVGTASAESYYVEAIDASIELPEGLTVKEETEDDESTLLTIGMKGRTDVGYGIRFAYYEEYEGICTNDMPDDLFSEMKAYYESFLDCSDYSAPQILDWFEDDDVILNPMMICGKNSNGELMLYYQLILDGWDILVYGGTVDDSFDEDTAYAINDLYFSVLDMLMEE